MLEFKTKHFCCVNAFAKGSCVTWQVNRRHSSNLNTLEHYPRQRPVQFHQVAPNPINWYLVLLISSVAMPAGLLQHTARIDAS